MPQFPERLHFGYLLVDEAAQSSEAEICIPLSVVLPHISYPAAASMSRPHVTICGDWKQLGPRIEGEQCRNSDMDVSLLERLFDRKLYKDSPFSREHPGHIIQPASTPFCNLVKNYRSHPAILMLPSTLVSKIVSHINHLTKSLIITSISFIAILSRPSHLNPRKIHPYQNGPILNLKIFRSYLLR